MNTAALDIDQRINVQYPVASTRIYHGTCKTKAGSKGATWAHTIHVHRLLEPERAKTVQELSLADTTYGARLALNGNRLITANYSWHKNQDYAITSRRHYREDAASLLARRRDAEATRERDARTQVTRAPPRQHSVLYYVCRRRDSIAEGIRPATRTGAAAPPTTAAKAHTALTKTGSPWAIGLTADIRVALLQAQAEQGARHQMADATGEKLAISHRWAGGTLGRPKRQARPSARGTQRGTTRAQRHRVERMSSGDRPPGGRTSESDGVFRGSDGVEFDRSGHESFGSDPHAHTATIRYSLLLYHICNLI